MRDRGDDKSGTSFRLKLVFGLILVLTIANFGLDLISYGQMILARFR